MHSCCFVFCLLYCCGILFWHWCAFLAFEFWGLFLCATPPPKSAFASLAGGLFWWQCTLREPCKCYDLWLMGDPYVCVRQWEQSHVPRTTKAPRRRPFEELVRLVVCFSALLPPNSSGCSRRLTAVGRFARAFVRQKRDHSGRALAFSKTSSEDRKKGRWREGEGGKDGDREKVRLKKGRENLLPLATVPASLSCPPCLDLKVSQLGLVCVCAAKCWLISPRISPP